MSQRRYDPSSIEPKWQELWAHERTWEVPNPGDEAARGDIRAYEKDVFGGPLTPEAPNQPVLSEGKTAIVHCRDYIAFEPEEQAFEMIWTGARIRAARNASRTGFWGM